MIMEVTPQIFPPQSCSEDPDANRVSGQSGETIELPDGRESAYSISVPVSITTDGVEAASPSQSDCLPADQLCVNVHTDIPKPAQIFAEEKSPQAAELDSQSSIPDASVKCVPPAEIAELLGSVPEMDTLQEKDPVAHCFGSRTHFCNITMPLTVSSGDCVPLRRCQWKYLKAIVVDFTQETLEERDKLASIWKEANEALIKASREKKGVKVSEAKREAEAKQRIVDWAVGIWRSKHYQWCFYDGVRHEHLLPFSYYFMGHWFAPSDEMANVSHPGMIRVLCETYLNEEMRRFDDVISSMRAGNDVTDFISDQLSHQVDNLSTDATVFDNEFQRYIQALIRDEIKDDPRKRFSYSLDAPPYPKYFCFGSEEESSSAEESSESEIEAEKSGSEESFSENDISKSKRLHPRSSRHKPLPKIPSPLCQSRRPSIESDSFSEEINPEIKTKSKKRFSSFGRSYLPLWLFWRPGDFLHFLNEWGADFNPALKDSSIDHFTQDYIFSKPELNGHLHHLQDVLKSKYLDWYEKYELDIQAGKTRHKGWALEPLDFTDLDGFDEYLNLPAGAALEVRTLMKHYSEKGYEIKIGPSGTSNLESKVDHKHTRFRQATASKRSLPLTDRAYTVKIIPENGAEANADDNRQELARKSEASSDADFGADAICSSSQVSSKPELPGALQNIKPDDGVDEDQLFAPVAMDVDVIETSAVVSSESSAVPAHSTSNPTAPSEAGPSSSPAHATPMLGGCLDMSVNVDDIPIPKSKKHKTGPAATRNESNRGISIVKEEDFPSASERPGFNERQEEKSSDAEMKENCESQSSADESSLTSHGDSIGPEHRSPRWKSRRQDSDEESACESTDTKSEALGTNEKLKAELNLPDRLILHNPFKSQVQDPHLIGQGTIEISKKGFENNRFSERVTFYKPAFVMTVIYCVFECVESAEFEGPTQEDIMRFAPSLFWSILLSDTTTKIDSRFPEGLTQVLKHLNSEQFKNKDASVKRRIEKYRAHVKSNNWKRVKSRPLSAIAAQFENLYQSTKPRHSNVKEEESSSDESSEAEELDTQPESGELKDKGPVDDGWSATNALLKRDTLARSLLYFSYKRYQRPLHQKKNKGNPEPDIENGNSINVGYLSEDNTAWFCPRYLSMVPLTYFLKFLDDSMCYVIPEQFVDFQLQFCETAVKAVSEWIDFFRSLKQPVPNSSERSSPGFPPKSATGTDSDVENTSESNIKSNSPTASILSEKHNSGTGNSTNIIGVLELASKQLRDIITRIKIMTTGLDPDEYPNKTDCLTGIFIENFGNPVARSCDGRIQPASLPVTPVSQQLYSTSEPAYTENATPLHAPIPSTSEMCSPFRHETSVPAAAVLAHPLQPKPVLIPRLDVSSWTPLLQEYCSAGNDLCPPSANRRHGSRSRRERLIGDDKQRVLDHFLDADGFSKHSVSKASQQQKDIVYRHAVKEKLWAPALIRHNEKGRAVYAAANVYDGDFICEYGGEYLEAYGLAKLREVEYAAANKGSFMFFVTFRSKVSCVDGTSENYESGFARLINHSRKRPNLSATVVTQEKAITGDGRDALRPHLIFVASRDIAIGEEFLIDYGERNKQALKNNPWLNE